MDGVASAYYGQGKYAQAEALYSQTLEIRRRVLGPEHPDTLNSMNNLASEGYIPQGKYAQAETLLSQALEILRRVSGPERPDTLDVIQPGRGLQRSVEIRAGRGTLRSDPGT